MRSRTFRPSPALIISIIALIAALGGTAWAVSKNSVGNKQLKKNAVSASKIQNNAVTSGKIKARAVTGAKIADGAVTARKLSLSASAITDEVVPTGEMKTILAECKPGEKITGGGGVFVGTPTNLQAQGMHIVSSGLDDVGGVLEWEVQGFNGSGVDKILRAQAICVKAG